MLHNGYRMVASRRACQLASLAFLFIASTSICHAQGGVAEVEKYHMAVEYCRGNAPSRTAISPDETIVCFGSREIHENVDLSVVRRIRRGGMFVVTGYGGDTRSAIAASDLLRERDAAIVIYDYCLWSCSEFFFIASHKTYIVGQSLVVWQYFLEDCDVTLRVLPDLDLPKVWRADCPPPKERSFQRPVPTDAISRFYAVRISDPNFLPPPDSAYVRKKLKSLYGQTGIFPGIGWTLSPGHTRSLFKVDITYEDYPHSQTDATSLANRFHVRDVIYDP